MPLNDDFEERYATAIQCNDYAVLQLSKLKWLVLKQDPHKGITNYDGLGMMREPMHYKILATVSNGVQARGIIKDLIQGRLTEAMLDGSQRK